MGVVARGLTAKVTNEIVCVHHSHDANDDMNNRAEVTSLNKILMVVLEPARLHDAILALQGLQVRGVRHICAGRSAPEHAEGQRRGAEQSESSPFFLSQMGSLRIGVGGLN